MNRLNQIIIEGEVKAVMFNGDLVHVTIECNGFTFLIKATGNLTTVFFNKNTVGNMIRVVGSLENEGSTVFIRAEHIDFAPTK